MDANESDVRASADALLQLVHQLVRDTRRAAPPAVNLDSSFERELGLDSLARVELLLRTERAFGVSLPEQALYAAETPRDLLRLLRAGAARTTSWEAQVRDLAQDLPASEACTAPTLLDALDWHVARHPERLQVHLYEEERETPISYRELQQRSAVFAGSLVQRGLLPGQTVAIMLPTGRDYLYSFFGTLMAGAIPVPLYPPARATQVEDHLKRHLGILGNCRASALITVAQAKPLGLLLRAQVASLGLIATPEELGTGDVAFPPQRARPGDIAFLQYTSGSTGQPKGVMLTHANLIANIRAMGSAVGAGAGDVFVSWLPLYHDMGLIGAWFAALYLGFPTVLMSPLAFLTRPSRWLQAIHRHRGTLSGGPNFAYELCLKRIDAAELRGLDLSSWRYAFNGAEPVSPATLAAFDRRFRDYGLRPGALQPVYGLAECSVGLAFPPPGRPYRVDPIDRARYSAHGEAVPTDAPGALALPSCGRVLPGHYLRIVDAAGAELPDRQEGRLQFKGPSATQGYYRNPAETRRLFDGEWLDSGDLAYMADGELYISGRAKDLIIRGGRNLYPYELEQAVGALPGIRKGCVAVFASTDQAGGTERLVVLAETRATDPDTLAALRQQINVCAIDLIGMPADDIVLAPPQTVLKTSSGKIRRAASREYYERYANLPHPTLPWLQFARLASASVAPEIRRRLRALRGLAYGAWAWLALSALGLAALALAPAIRRPGAGWNLGHTLARSFLRLCGLPLLVHGLDRLPASGPLVIVANHASYLDAIVLLASLKARNYRFAAKRELARTALFRPLLLAIGTDFVERRDLRQSVDDATRIVETVAAGHASIVFAEGTFNRNTGLLPFRMGAFVAAARNGVPLVPIALRGTRSVLRDGSWLLRRGPIAVTVSPPLLAADSGWNAAVALRDAARAQILLHCGEPDAAAPTPD